MAGAITIVALTSYAWMSLKKDTRPSSATWWCWALSGMLIALSLNKSGGSDTLVVAFDYAVGPLIIAIIVTARYGSIGTWSHLEKFCVVGSIVGGLFWWKFNSPQACFTITLTIDCLGAIPTIYKACVKPKDESVVPWMIFTVGSGLNIMASKENMWEIIYVWAILVIDLLILVPLIIPRRSDTLKEGVSR